MSGWPPKSLRDLARDLPAECPDCSGTARFWWSTRKLTWIARVTHRSSCVSRRSARQKRAVERYLADELAAELHLADYAVDGKLFLARHRTEAAP